MAKKPPAPKEETSDQPGMLPVPEPVIRHHGASVFGAMREWTAQKRVPPVLLLTGTAGCGKRSISYWLAQWILCETRGMSTGAAPGDTGTPDDQDPFTSSLFGDMGAAPPPAAEPEPQAPASGDPGPCGECNSCRRAIQGNWVDFTEVLPEDSGDGSSSSSTGTLKVDQFREIKRKLGFGAHEGAYRIVLIPNADRMTVQAANSVLKLLEEPPPGWLFFLTASDPTLGATHHSFALPDSCGSSRFNAEELEELLGLSGVNRTTRQDLRGARPGQLEQGAHLGQRRDLGTSPRRFSAFSRTRRQPRRVG